MKKLLIAMIVVFGFAGPALAGHCPRDAQKIRQVLESQNNAEAQALLEKGVSLHESGKHGESLDALHEAMAILGLEH